jgi:hypothetical protein
MNLMSNENRKENVVGITEMCRIFEVSPRTLRF